MADKRISQLVDRGTVVNNDVIPIVVSGASTTNKATISSIQTFMQGNLDVGVTSVGITLGSTGTDVNVSGSPVTSSGNITINIPSASATNRGLVTTGAQTIAGAKTFSSDAIINGVIVGRGSGTITANTIVGADALYANTTGTSNTAIGQQTLSNNTTGEANAAVGHFSMLNNISGTANTANGGLSLHANTSGSINTAIGYFSLYSNTTGSGNTAIGNISGGLIAGGIITNSISNNSVFIGAETKAQANNQTNQIVIGYQAVGNGSNTVTIGNSSITSNKLFGKVIHADAVAADESATLGQVNTTLGGYVTLATTQTITAQKTFTTSGGSDSVIITTTGAGFALDAIKAGNGEVIRVNKTSGTGNAMTVIGGNFEAPTIVKTGGTSAQFLKADGSVDSSTYLTTASATAVYVPYTGANSGVNLGQFNLSASSINVDGPGVGLGSYLGFKHSTSVTTGSDGYTSMYTFGTNTIGFKSISGATTKDFSFSMVGITAGVAGGRIYNLPDASGTLALTTDLGAYLPLAGGTLTGALNGTSASFNTTNAITLTASDSRIRGGDTTGRLLLANSGTTTYGIFHGSSHATLPNAIQFYNDNTLSLSLASTGAATFSAATAAITLTANGAANQWTTKILASSTTSQSYGLTVQAGTNASDIAFQVIPVSGSGSLLQILGTGAATFSSTLTSTDLTIKNSANAETLDLFLSPSTSNGFIDYPSGRSLTIRNKGSLGSLTLASTGAATFSSSIVGTGGVMSLQKNGSGTVGSGPYYTLYNAATTDGMLFQLNASNNIDFWGLTSNSFTASPVITLTRAGAATFSSSVTAGDIFSTDGTRINFFGVGTGANVGYVGMTTNHSLAFLANNSEKMRITSGGNVGIGVSPASANRFVVKGEGTTGSFNAISLQDSGATDLFYIRCDGYINSGLKSVSPYNFSTSGRSMIVDSAGGIGYLVSTRESKSNIEPIKNVDFINQLNPVQFNYRKKDNLDNTYTDEVYENVNYGFIADEVESINKELVFYNEDGTLAGVEYNNMIAILTKAVQELKTEIDSLKNQMQ